MSEKDAKSKIFFLPLHIAFLLPILSIPTSHITLPFLSSTLFSVPGLLHPYQRPTKHLTKFSFSFDVTGLGLVDQTVGRLRLFICLLVVIAGRPGQAFCLCLPLNWGHSRCVVWFEKTKSGPVWICLSHGGSVIFSYTQTTKKRKAKCAC